MIVAPVYIAVIWSNILAADGGLLNYYIQKIGFDAVGWLTDRRVALKTIVGIEVWRLTGFAMLTFIAGIKNISKDYFEAASLKIASRSAEHDKPEASSFTEPLFIAGEPE